MAAAPIEYKGLEPTGRNYSFYLTLTTASSGNKRKADGEVSIPQYVGVKKQGSGTTPPELDTSRFFCRLSLPYKDNAGKEREQIAFCLLGVLSSRCQKIADRREDYNAAGSGRDWPFKLWTKRGEFLDPGPQTVALTVAPTSSESFDDWDKEQLKRWKVLAKAASKSIPSSDWTDVVARFKNLPENGGQYAIYFSPNDPIVFGIDRDTLEELVNKTLGSNTYPVVEFSAAKNDTSLCCVGSNPFALYHIWMRPDQFEDLWTYDLDGKAKLPAGELDLPRPFPMDRDSNSFKEIDSKMKSKGIKDIVDKAPTIRISFEKLLAARYATRSDYPDQIAVWGKSPNFVRQILLSLETPCFITFSGGRKSLERG
jgi:hypothetical protein